MGSIHSHRVARHRRPVNTEPASGAGPSSSVRQGVAQPRRVAHGGRGHLVGPVLAAPPQRPVDQPVGARAAGQRVAEGDGHLRDGGVVALHVGQLVGDHPLGLDEAQPVRAARS